MMMKQDTMIPPPSVSTKCSNCSVEERRLLHNVRHRGIFRRLCTSCVLKLHPQSFCPTCFVVYDRSPPPSSETVTCFKCYSSSHTLCVDPKAPKPYSCPPCANPSAPIFSLKWGSDEEIEGAVEKCRTIDKKAARVLLAAATIAAVSMGKAAVAARAEAERRAKEAASTRKRARDALEHVACLVAREKDKPKRKEMISAEVSVAGTANVLDKNHRAAGGNGVGVHLNHAMALQNRIAGNQRGADGVDGASEVLASLNAVDLKGKERLQGFRVQNPVSGPLNKAVPMVIEEKDRPRVNPVPNNHVTASKNEGSADLSQFKSNSAQGENVKIGPLTIFNAGANQGSREDNVGSQKDL